MVWSIDAFDDARDLSSILGRKAWLLSIDHVLEEIFEMDANLKQLVKRRGKHCSIPLLTWWFI